MYSAALTCNGIYMKTAVFNKYRVSYSNCRWMNKRAARQECATLIKFCAVCTELQRDAAAMLLWFVGCQNSTTFKLAPLGMRGAQEQTLLVSENNIGTYLTCNRINMKTAVLRFFFKKSTDCHTAVCIQKYNTQHVVQTAIHHQRKYCI